MNLGPPELIIVLFILMVLAAPIVIIVLLVKAAKAKQLPENQWPGSQPPSPPSEG